MNLEELYNIKPKLHRDSDDKEVSWAISYGLMNYIDGAVSTDSTTLEIGAGVSTLVFAMNGSKHISVVPDITLANRVKSFCGKHKIDTSALEFIIGESEIELPGLTPRELDLILIDGRHGFPAPFIDWYYTAGSLKLGGVLIVDDTHIWTGEVLRNFLNEDRAWRLIQDIDDKTAVFHKLEEGSHKKEWHHQVYVKTHSRYQPEQEKTKAIWAYKVRRAKELLREGKISTLFKKLSSNLFN